MKKVVSVGLVLLLAVVGIAGCFGNGEVEEYLPVEERVVTLEELGILAMPEIITPTDYSQFVGDWYNYFAAGTTILQISEIDENEITFNMILLGGEDENPVSRSGPYTLPIVGNRVHLKRSDMRSDDDWFESHNTIIFSGDEIFWMWESSWSRVDYAGTVHVGGGTMGIYNGEFYIRFRPLEPIREAGYWTWLDELLD